MIAAYVAVAALWLIALIIGTDPWWLRPRAGVRCPRCQAVAAQVTGAHEARCANQRCRVVSWDPARRWSW